MEWILVLGVVTGMRTMTAIAAVCWAAWLTWLPETGWAMWTTYLVSAVVFSVMALGEYYGDTLATTPSRKAPGPALARIVFAGLVGALAAKAISEPLAGGILVGIAGALIGTWGGFAARQWGAKQVGNDLPVALMESAFALALAAISTWKLHTGILIDMRRGAV